MISQKLKDKWVAALRSGKYQQGFGMLYRGPENASPKRPADTYCCLGVLCIVTKKIPKARMDGLGHIEQVDSHLQDALGVLNAEYLISLNDTDHFSFDRIADYIEANIKALPPKKRADRPTPDSPPGESVPNDESEEGDEPNV